MNAVDKISNFYEWNVEQGGPIIKNKLWFFGAFRKARYDRPIANTYGIPAGTANVPAAFQACLQPGAGCEQGTSDEKMDNPVLRLTWQASEKNKIALYADRAMRLRGHAMASLTDPATASVVWHTPTFATGSAKWTSTVSSKLLFETGFSFNRERYDNVYQDGLDQPRGSAAWYAGARKNDNRQRPPVERVERAARQLSPTSTTAMAALSYVTGTHNIKFGYQYQWGVYPRYNNANADLYQTYNNGVPFQVTVLNTPLEVREDLNANLASTPRTRGT